MQQQKFQDGSKEFRKSTTDNPKTKFSETGTVIRLSAKNFAIFSISRRADLFFLKNIFVIRYSTRENTLSKATRNLQKFGPMESVTSPTTGIEDRLNFEGGVGDLVQQQMLFL